MFTHNLIQKIEMDHMEFIILTLKVQVTTQTMTMNNINQA